MEDFSWLPDYFFLIRKEETVVEGYVHSASQLNALLQLHSQNTLSHFYRTTVRSHPVGASSKQLSQNVKGLPRGYYMNKKTKITLYACIMCKNKLKEKKQSGELFPTQAQGRISQKSGEIICVHLSVSEIEIYSDYCTHEKTRAQIKEMREILFEKLQSNTSSSVKKGFAYKVLLPLNAAHKFHSADPQWYWEHFLKQKICRRTESLIRQGLCQRHVLKDMLVSYIENELLLEYQLPKDFDLTGVYPSKHFLCSFIHRYHTKNPVPNQDKILILRKIKQEHINKVQEDLLDKVPWMPPFLKVTEVTDKFVSGWLEDESQLEQLISQVEERTKCKFHRRRDTNAERLVKEDKIQLSLAPIPINIHPFKIKDIFIYSCSYDRTPQLVLQGDVYCQAQLVAYKTYIFKEYILPCNISKLYIELRSKFKHDESLNSCHLIFVTLPLIEAHSCHQIIGSNFVTETLSIEEKFRRKITSVEEIEKIRLNNNFDIIYNSCIVGDTASDYDKEYDDHTNSSPIKEHNQKIGIENNDGLNYDVVKIINEDETEIITVSLEEVADGMIIDEDDKLTTVSQISPPKTVVYNLPLSNDPFSFRNSYHQRDSDSKKLLKEMATVAYPEKFIRKSINETVQEDIESNIIPVENSRKNIQEDKRDNRKKICTDLCYLNIEGCIDILKNMRKILPSSVNEENTQLLINLKKNLSSVYENMLTGEYDIKEEIDYTCDMDDPIKEDFNYKEPPKKKSKVEDT